VLEGRVLGSHEMKLGDTPDGAENQDDHEYVKADAYINHNASWR
jgi:hypothetical protein